MSALPLRHPVTPESVSAIAGAGLWRASELAHPIAHTLPSGHTALDAELPGGGWPLGQLIDVLQPPFTQAEWRLLLPALRQTQAKGPLVLIGAPFLPHLPALAHQGIAAERVFLINASTIEERLWAAEQALRCHELGAMLVWLPHAQPAALRRLQLASRQIEAHTHAPAGVPPLPFVVALRPLAYQSQACAAPLRLTLHSQGRNGLDVTLFKRLGPPMEQALRLIAALPAWACLANRPAPADSTNNVIHWNTHAVDRIRAHQRAPAVA